MWNFLYGVVVGMVVREIVAWLPRLSDRMINRAVSRLPEAEKEKCRTRWFAEQKALPDAALTRIARGLFCNARASATATPGFGERLFYFGLFISFAKTETRKFFKEPVAYGTLKERWMLHKGIWNEMLFDNPKHGYPIQEMAEKLQIIKQFSESRDVILDDLKKRSEEPGIRELLTEIESPEFQNALNTIEPFQEHLERVTKAKNDLSSARDKIKARRAVLKK